MNCCDERRLVSVVTRVEYHHRARGGSRSGDGAGGGAQFLPWWLRSFLGSWRLFIYLKK